MKTCRDVTELIEQRSVRRLGIREKLAIRAHLRICKNCRNYSRDSKVLEQLIRRLSSDKRFSELSSEEKLKMIESLRRGNDQ